MEQNSKQQATKLIDYSSNILIIGGQPVDADYLGSALALYSVLKTMGKNVTAACIDVIPKNIQFFPNLEEVQQNFSGTRNFIISVDTTHSEPDKLSYNIEGNKLNIIITPKTGNFTESDVSFYSQNPKYDLIIVLDTSELSQLGQFYEENRNLFLEVPIINIDHHVTNRFFGKINLVDTEATSTSEILVSLIESFGTNYITGDVATYLLAGIIYDTWSFQNANTTPKSLTVSAQLVAAGADHQKIIQNVLKAKPASVLKLWGKILSGIKENKEYRFAWAAIPHSDLEEVSEEDTDTASLMNQFLGHVQNADLVVLLKEKEPNLVSGSLRTSVEEGVDVAKIARAFGGGGHQKAAGFIIEEISLEEAIEKVIAEIKKYQTERGVLAEKSPTYKLPQKTSESEETSETVSGKIADYDEGQENREEVLSEEELPSEELPPEELSEENLDTELPKESPQEESFKESPPENPPKTQESKITFNEILKKIKEEKEDKS